MRASRTPTKYNPRRAKLIVKLKENMEMIAEGEKPDSLGKIIKDSGYGTGYQQNPHILLEKKGVREALAKYGITNDTLAAEWKKVLEAEPDPEKFISWDSKIKGLAHLNRALFEEQNRVGSPQIAFIEKFISLRQMGLNAPKEPKDL